LTSASRAEPANSKRRPRALTVAAVTAAVTLASGVFGLFFDLWPSARPDPRAQVGADVAIVAIDRYVTRDEYLKRRYATPALYDKARKAEVALAGGTGGLTIPGQLAYVRVQLHGMKGSRVSLLYSLYDARSQTRIKDATEQSHWSGDAPDDRFIAEVWLQPVIGPQRDYSVRVEVRDTQGVLLGFADSRPFKGLDPRRF
jgi:hypothetical protein